MRLACAVGTASGRPARSVADVSAARDFDASVASQRHAANADDALLRSFAPRPRGPDHWRMASTYRFFRNISQFATASGMSSRDAAVSAAQDQEEWSEQPVGAPRAAEG